MAAALTPPLLVAAGVLVLAGALKLRNPVPAARATRVLGLPAGGRVQLLVRSIGAFEVVLGGWAMIAPGRAAAAALACLYAIFAVVALLLVRRQASCGCFGEDRAPASVAQSLLSAAFAAAAAVAAVIGSHGLSWVLAQSAVLVIGIAGGVYATVLAYTELPAAWSAWSAQ